MYLVPGDVHSPGGGVVLSTRWGVSDLGGCLLWGLSAPASVPGPGRVYLVPGGSVPGGCSGGVSTLGGVSAPWEVSAPGWCTWSGGSTWSGGVPGLWGAPGQVLPPVDKMTHASENITLPQTSFASGNNT